MKKILIAILSFILICFLMPILFTNKSKKIEVGVDVTDDPQIEETSKTYDYKKFNKVKLLHSKTKKVEEVSLDQYLYGVVSAEMPASFDEEALKAQAVVARTYTIYMMQNEKKHENADICDNPNCCQAWISKKSRFKKWEKDTREENWNRIVEGVDSTKRKSDNI